MGFCFELPARGACLSLLITRAFFSTRQSLADDQVKMSFMDCSVLRLLSLHSCLLLSLKIGVNLVQGEEEGYIFYLLGFIRGVKNRCLTFVLGHF